MTVENLTSTFEENHIFKWGTILVLFLVVVKLVDTWRTRRLMKKLGAKPVPVGDGDNLLGFRALYWMLRKKREGRMIDFTKERFDMINKDTFQVRIGGISMITTRDPENLKALLATQFNDFDLGLRHAQFKPVLGDGIFTLDGDGWKTSRAMLRPQFAREQVSHVKLLEPHLQILVKHIEKHRGAEFDIQPYFFRLTLDTSTEFLFDESVGSLVDETVGMISDATEANGKLDFTEAFNKSQEWLSSRAVMQRLYFLYNTITTRKHAARVHKFADFYVNKAINASPEDLEKKEGYTFLYELVKNTKDPRILRDQLLNILIAGRDTTAGLLSFTFFELARNPEILAKLRREVESTFGIGQESRIDDITFESLKKCEYLKCVLNETLRMYPSVPQNFRVSNKDTTLPRGGGVNGLEPVFVPKGKTITYSIYTTHRDERFYGKDAEVFRPERWTEPETRKLGWAYLPFNGGPRICLGQQYALTEASYVVVRLLQIFPNLTGTPQEYPPKKNSQLTMQHNDGVWISLT